MYRIAHITTVHPIFDRRIFYKQAISLAKNGYEVFLIATSTEPVSEIVDGVHMVTIKKPQNKVERLFLTGYRAVRKAVEIRADIYHFHDPELIPWCLILKIFGKKVVMDVHEDYPAVIQDMPWIPQLLKKGFLWGIKALEIIGAKAFDGVVTTDDSLNKKFLCYNGKALVVSAENHPIIDFKTDAFEIDKSRYASGRIFFLGGINPARCIREFVGALELLCDLEYTAIVGGRYNDPLILEDLKKSLVWSKVKFLGCVPVDQISDLMAECSFSINLYSNQPNHHGMRSNRIFEALLAGLPVIVSDFPRIKDFVNRYHCGIAVNPEDPKAIAAAIIELIINPDLCMHLGLNGREAALRHFNWESQAEKIVVLYQTILTQS
jgi:glycosyltransferase involved in cell wall biosynthesis